MEVHALVKFLDRFEQFTGLIDKNNRHLKCHRSLNIKTMISENKWFNGRHVKIHFKSRLAELGCFAVKGIFRRNPLHKIFKTCLKSRSKFLVFLPYTGFTAMTSARFSWVMLKWWSVMQLYLCSYILYDAQFRTLQKGTEQSLAILTSLVTAGNLDQRVTRFLFTVVSIFSGLFRRRSSFRPFVSVFWAILLHLFHSRLGRLHLGLLIS